LVRVAARTPGHELQLMATKFVQASHGGLNSHLACVLRPMRGMEDKKYGEEAGRRYDDKTEKFAKSGKAEKAARDARHSVDTPQGEKRYEEAVERGKIGPNDRER
jgi:hypothetical protein